LKGNSIPLDLTAVEMNWPLEILRLSATRLASLEGIGRVATLRSFHAADNNLQGGIPDELYSLTALRQLYLSFNSFNGTIAPEISSLVDLEQLYLFDNEISGTIPDELGLLSRLTEVVLAENRLKGNIPSSLTQHPKLEQLQLHNQKGDDLINGLLPDFREAINLW
jgi:Leucine-rich repeat (LRR) protein